MDFLVFRGLLVVIALCASSPVWAAKVPSDNEQEILIRTTLMTFNDANVTGNYSVLRTKASKEFQSELGLEDLAKAFARYRTLNVNIESIVADEIASYEDARIDKNGVLHLIGAFKDDEKRVNYDLKFIPNNGAWKILGLNVRYKED